MPLQTLRCASSFDNLATVARSTRRIRRPCERDLDPNAHGVQIGDELKEDGNLDGLERRAPEEGWTPHGLIGVEEHHEGCREEPDDRWLDEIPRPEMSAPANKDEGNDVSHEQEVADRQLPMRMQCAPTAEAGRERRAPA